MKPDVFLRHLDENPVIAAVKDMDGLEKAIASNCEIIFVLFGDILNIPEITARIKTADKVAMLHVDLIEGLAYRDVSIDYIAKYTSADGILSTKLNLARRAGVCGLLAVQRFFLLDSMALANIHKQYSEDAACAIEILPGIIPKAISRLTKDISAPVIAGGLVNDKEDVINALNAGARAVSSSNQEVWFL
ncbi:MAG: glycerol-3-phosphate responsive antiterminator [Clostridiales bacterium]|jgi:glycerol-3-phosphate responsive antiterminator|nr:glycerol-3-phosphate responsive antiterminator [Clostridiales bacterium]